MNRLNMNFSGYPFDGNLSQTSNEVPFNEASYSVSNKRKKMESETESKEEKIASLTEQRFNGSDIEEPPVKKRKVVKGGQKGKENIEESETVVHVPEMADEMLWEHLKRCLPAMPRQSFFCFPGELKVERDLIKELLKNPPADSLKDLCAVQTVNCKEDGEKMTLNGFERACLKQHSQVFEHILTDSFHQEADIQTPIDWTIKKSILELFLKSLYHPNILDEQKEKILIKLLDQANLCEAEQLIEALVGKIQKHIILSIREKGDEGLARITNYWHEFASIRGLSSLQRSCEDLLMNHFWDAKDDQQRQHRIEKLKSIQLDQLDLSDRPYDEFSNYLTYIRQLPLTELNLSSQYIRGVEDLALLKDLSLKTFIFNSTDNIPISDNGLIYFQNFTNLRVLSLGYLPSQITDKGLAHLKNLPLEKLIISDFKIQQQQLADEAIAYLKNFKNLQMLALFINREELLVHLADLPNLRTLHLGIKQGLSNHLTHLKALPLEELCLYRGESNITGSDLKNLEGLPLRKLSLINSTNIEDAALVHLKKFPLEELYLESWKISDDAGLALLSDLSSLKKLQVDSLNLTGTCLNHLQNLPLLEDLSIKISCSKEEDLLCLANLPLKRFVLPLFHLTTDKAFSHLQHLRLKELHLSGGTLENFSFLKNMPLQILYLKSHKLTDEDLSYLKDLPLLQLTLTGSEKLNGSGLVHLKDSPLRELHLYIGHEFDYKNLVLLKDFKNLLSLTLSLPMSIIEENKEIKEKILSYLDGLILKKCSFIRSF